MNGFFRLWLGMAMALLTACGGAPPPVCLPAQAAPPLEIATSQSQPVALAAAVPSVWSDADSPIPVDSQDPMWGSREAPVTIVIFSDFQCPFCARVEPTLEQIKKAYGKENVRLIWKNQPLHFHPNAKPAAEAAMGVFAIAGVEAFWKFHDRVFANQSALGTDSYVAWAKQAGVADEAGFRRDLEAHTWASKVEQDMAVASQVGANGTPHFLINGVEVSGAQPFDKFKDVIDAELANARASLAAGTRPDRVYVELSKKNKGRNATPPPPKAAAPEDDDKTAWLVPVGAAPARGSDAALVTIVEFSDFQCPYCKRVLETLEKVRTTYGDKVRIVWKNEPLPFHNRAEPAAELAMFAWKQKGNAGFWAAHDKLFASQPKLEDDDLAAIAKGLGLDAHGAKQAIDTHKYKALIDADADLADDVRASGTPHFFINGHRLVGAQPFEKFQAVIDEELERAKARVARGTPAKGVYAQIMKTAQGPGPPEQKTAPLPSYAIPAKGSPRAKVVIQEFSDFQCPFCARVQPTIKELVAGYGDRVRLVFRHKPLAMHGDAPLAAEAAMEAFEQKGSDGFWKMHDLLFRNQVTPDGLGQEALEKYAAEIGLDPARFHAALAGRVHRAAVDAESKAADDAGITGTPAFIINGYFVSGAQPAAKFRKVIDRALSDSKGK
jgi:protein-disulfide isomerase